MKVDLKGERFGKLTVLEETEERQDGYVVWRCQCACGNTCMVSTKHLHRGTKKHCGCDDEKISDDDFVGRTFGKLTVNKRANRTGKTIFWQCTCDCGNTKTVSTHNLISGRIKSCASCVTKCKYLDLTGKKIGCLLIVEKTEQRTKSGSVIWRCRCDCGAECCYSASDLIHGSTVSCGCYRKNVLPQRLNSKLHRVNGTCIERLLSKKPRSDSKSGYVGINITGNGRYRAMIGFQGKRFSLGVYDNLQDALMARKRGEQIHMRFLEEYQEKMTTED